jgi:hypothetical protein
MLAFSVPPGYRRTKPLACLKLGAFTAIIDAIVEAWRSLDRWAVSGPCPSRTSDRRGRP